MFQRFHAMKEEKDGGFTLIELLVVIIIIGILAAIAIPVFLNQRKKGYDTAAKSDLRSVATAEESYLTDHTAYLASDGASALTNGLADFKRTAEVSIGVTVNGAIGFCAVAKHASSNTYH